MPSVERNNTKTDVMEKKSVVAEVETPIKMCISILDKKLRNLEKRKGKLDSYKEKSDKGEKLNKDQQEAVSKYEVVIQNLEFARDLQKQFSSLGVEVEKLQKKQAKREKIEKQHQDSVRLQDILKLQTTLDSLGADEVRRELLKHKTLVLKEADLNHLDEFYTLIVPIRNGEKSFDEHLTLTSEHLLAYLDRSEKSVVGTTYKNLSDLVARINGCGYFDGLTDEMKTSETNEFASYQHSKHDGDEDLKKDLLSADIPDMEPAKWYKEDLVVTSNRLYEHANEDPSRPEIYSFNFLQDSQIQSGLPVVVNASNGSNMKQSIRDKQYSNGEHFSNKA